jgi:hypothetical protein
VIDSTEGVISMATCDVRRPMAAALMALMVAGSVAVWTVIPIAGLWFASQLSGSFTQMGALQLLAAVAGIPAAMAIAGRLLVRVERLYLRVTGTAPQARALPAWRRSLGDSRAVRLTVLDRIMVASVLMAVIAMAVWFVAFAGSSLPT